MDGIIEATSGALFLLAAFLIVPGLVAGLTEELRRPRKVSGRLELPRNVRRTK
jgi:hypothetical protein